LRTARRPLLTQDIGHVIGAESARRGSFFYSAGHIFRAVLPDQFQQFGGLAAPPGARITDDIFHAIVNGDRAGVGLDDETAADIALVDTVTIAVECQAEIFVDERFGDVAVIVRNDRQRFESFGLKAFQRPLTGFAMHPLIGDLGQPLPHLPVHIVEIGELAQRPEVLAKVSDGAFDLAFFPAAGGIAGMRVEAIITRESEEPRQKANETAIMFDDRGSEIVIGDLARDSAQSSEGVNVTAGEGPEALAVGELALGLR